jgi:hypothetical protein
LVCCTKKNLAPLLGSGLSIPTLGKFELDKISLEKVNLVDICTGQLETEE